MSEVEQLYERLQQQTGGNIPWNNLPVQHQQIFIQAVNHILQITAQRS